MVLGKEGAPHRIMFTKSCSWPPIFLCGMYMGMAHARVGVGVNLWYLSWSDGVSCKILFNVLITPACWNKAIYYRLAFATPLLRPLHQVYQKKLNNNKNVYLPKMVSLKWGCRGFGVCEEFIVRRGWYQERKACPHGVILTKRVAHTPYLFSYL